MKSLVSIALCLAADAVVAVGDFLSKRWVQGLGWRYFVSAYLLYILVIGLWFALIKYLGDVGRSGVIWSIGGIAASLLIGSLCFAETLSVTNKIGVALCLAGVALTAVKP